MTDPAPTDPVDTLLVDVRASTQGFASDVAQLRASFDGTLVAGFVRGGSVLDRSLTEALRRGGLGFEALRRVAEAALAAIIARVGGVLSLAGDRPGRSGLPAALDLLAGLPGRATGGPVAPGRGYLVGERGPELFVPASAGRIEPAAAAAPRVVQVAITVQAPSATSAPRALELSARQIAGAVRRALRDV